MSLHFILFLNTVLFSSLPSLRWAEESGASQEPDPLAMAFERMKNVSWDLLAVQWLRVYASTIGGVNQSVVGELGSHKTHGTVKNKCQELRGLFKNIRDTKGTFHAKMGSIKDRNGIDLTEAENIKKRWQEYTKELYKKDLHDPDNHDGVITHLDPDILECEVKWALESITTNKASGGDGIPVELFQISKDDAVKVLHSICQQIWKTQEWSQDWKRSVFIPIPQKVMSKDAHINA